MNRIKVVVIGSGNNADRFISENIDNRFIDVIGKISDEGLNDNIRLLDDADLGFALGYSKIIPSEICEKYFIINLHAGILPKWRGFSANAWALMNGEKEIGYSLHRITSKLDGGLLYYVKHIPVSDEETMSDVYELMIDSIVKECPEILYKISNEEIAGYKQSAEGIAYCTRFNASMGIISRFSLSATHYVNLYRCMAKPLGSGVFFKHKGLKYEVGKIENGKKYGVINYLCQEGKIVNIEDNKMWVKVKDNVIVLSNIKKDDGLVSVKDCFRNGQMIGGD